MAVYPSAMGPSPQFENTAGEPAVGDFLYYYIAGSNTKQNTYTDSTGNTANPNPVVLNALGMPSNEVWWTEGALYKVVWSPSTDTDPPTNPIRTWDNLSGIGDPSFITTTSDQWVLYSAAATYISGTSFSVVGDQTSIFQIGRRVQTVNTGGTIVYSTITNSVFGANTTVTLSNDSGVLDSGLSAVYYGIISPTNTSLASINANSPTTAFSISNSGAGNALAVDTTGLVVDTDGRVVNGSASAIVGVLSVKPAVQTHSVSSGGTGLAVFNWYDGGGFTAPSAALLLFKSDSNVVGTHSAISSTSPIGSVNFYGDDGTSFVNAAAISVMADGAVSSGIVPGAITVSTADAAGASTERLRISSSGALFFSGATSTNQITTGAVDAKYISFTLGTLNSSRSVTSSAPHQNFYNPNGLVGTITTSASATAYNTSSDYRLKQDWKDLTGSGSFIDSIIPRTWVWRVDGTKGVGFLAHELQEVSPQSVTGTKDEEDKEGNPVYQAVEYGSAEVIAHIVAELKSLRKRVSDLEQQ